MILLPFRITRTRFGSRLGGIDAECLAYEAGAEGLPLWEETAGTCDEASRPACRGFGLLLTIRLRPLQRR
jgi:hypothetical protein